MGKDFGLIGLAVMGENLAMNIANHGFSMSVFNRDTAKVKRFTEGRAKELDILGTYSLEEFVGSLKKPRKIMMMVKAGQPVDDLIEKLLPIIEKGDILIDGGNSYFYDTRRRTKYLEEKGILYIGSGVSGGEEGALLGPSIMPGGSPAAWAHVKPILQAISAKTADGTPCCDWIGSDGAGHFVKMVHNGIEYGDMQLICEIYFIMKNLLGMSAPEIGDVFTKWNQNRLDSYLVEITADICHYIDEDGTPIVDYILDTAGQKGTGKWTSQAALDFGVPLTLISEAVYARSLSAIKEERVLASKAIAGPAIKQYEGDKEAFLSDLENALFASKIVSYAQGFVLMDAASKEFEWDLKLGDIAMLWRGGCIIRSVFLEKIRDAYKENPALSNLLMAPYFTQQVTEAQESFRRVLSQAILNGISVPALSSALSYFDGYRSEKLPANLLQGQRDYFGAHMYERTDKPRGEFFHTNWTGRGGNTVSSTYIV